MRTEKIIKLRKGQTAAHQGDVVLRRVAKLPDGLKRIEPRPLALGELSGHRHLAVAERPDLIDFYEDAKGNIWLVNKSAMKIRHENADGSWTQEHHTIVTEPAIWQVQIQRVRDPFTATINSVKD